MKIDSYAIGMESARSYKASAASRQSSAVTEYGGSAGTTSGGWTMMLSSGGSGKGDTKGASSSKMVTVAQMQTLTERIQSTRSNYRIRSGESQTTENIRVNTLQYILQQLFEKHRNRFSGFFGENAAQPSIGNGPTTYYGNGNPLYYRSTYLGEEFGTKDLLFADPVPVAGISSGDVRYVSETYNYEKETTTYSTTGTVRCADGREIDFGLSFEMSREFESYAKQELGLSVKKMVDPLVINLDTNIASVSDQTFYFDLDADGELDEISQLGAGSGFLALDKDGNGRIDDGSELFGTASGDGFADLAEYDKDGNGWIDENDEIWSKLKVWTKDTDGNDVLYSLAEAGVGAICLRKLATDYTLTDTDSSAAKAQIRSTGVFLYENGNVGTLQHLDLRKFEKDA